jgi:diacylglycerol kinase family enzyme
MSSQKPKDVVLLCNPQAGGRWRALADVLDSEEAKGVRRIVTDEIEDVREAITGLGQRVDLLCIYGGDGTIFRVIAELLRHAGPDFVPPRLALLGGGTMNVTSRWCGMSSVPGDNFRTVMQAYTADRLVYREVPVLSVTSGGQEAYGFTFGIGPLVRILERYESGTKGHLSALGIAVKSIGAAVSKFPRSYAPVLQELEAGITVDGQALPYSKYAAVFANVTGAINPFIEPFTAERTRDSFHFLAYAVSSREFAMLAPLLARAQLPIDPKSLLRPMSTWKQGVLSLLGKGELPADPRYVNHPARHLRLRCHERHFTIDGELLPLVDGAVEVKMGPALRLALVNHIL